MTVTRLSRIACRNLEPSTATNQRINGDKASQHAARSGTLTSYHQGYPSAAINTVACEFHILFCLVQQTVADHARAQSVEDCRNTISLSVTCCNACCNLCARCIGLLSIPKRSSARA